MSDDQYIDDIVDSFRKAWRSSQPELSNHLEAGPEPRRASLFLALLHADDHERRKHGLSRGPSNYSHCDSKYADIVLDYFQSTTSSDEPRKINPDVPAQITDFELLDVLGKGGMGRVYRACQRSLGIIVALKSLTKVGDEQKARFCREARCLAGLKHTNIVSAYQIGEMLDGRLFFTMDYVEGPTLEDYIPARAPLSLEHILITFRQIADGIAAAHRQGIVHRDLKPANIIVGPDTCPRITDFGLATSPGARSAEKLTISGALIGTVKYMAPEQASGNTPAIGTWSDVHALGAILYEMLTSRPAYDGEG